MPKFKENTSAFKMKGMSFGPGDRKDKKILKESNKKLIEEQRKKFKSGEISREEFKAAKKEIRKYTDVQSAKDYLGRS